MLVFSLFSQSSFIESMVVWERRGKTLSLVLSPVETPPLLLLAKKMLKIAETNQSGTKKILSQIHNPSRNLLEILKILLLILCISTSSIEVLQLGKISLFCQNRFKCGRILSGAIPRAWSVTHAIILHPFFGFLRHRQNLVNTDFSVLAAENLSPTIDICLDSGH